VKSETRVEGMLSACFRNCQAKHAGSPSSGIFFCTHTHIYIYIYIYGYIYIYPYECVCVCVSLCGSDDNIGSGAPV